METVQLNVSSGYKLEEEKLVVPIKQACDLLFSKKKRKYSYATVHGSTVELTSHFIRCPYCHQKTYAYARDLNKAFDLELKTEKRITNEDIRIWAPGQITFFGDERRCIILNRYLDISWELTCPKCKSTMNRCDTSKLVEISHSKHKINVRAEISTLEELLTSPCISTGEVYVDFPMSETVCFNFKNGHTYARLETRSGKCLAVRDLTTDKYAWTSGATYNAINGDKYVKRTLSRMFSDEWGSSIPFPTASLDVQKMRILTMFIGYDQEFYSAIPFAKASLEVEADFKSKARKLHRAKDTVALYENSKLPSMKSVRKLFFTNPSLFFYLDEAEQLWELFKDPNFFIRLLKEKNSYKRLSTLHMRPLLFVFLKDYMKVCKNDKFFRLLCKRWNRVCGYGCNYVSLSKHMQSKEQAKWQKDDSLNFLNIYPSFAIPMCNPNEKICDRFVNGFKFSWLKTTLDYEEAGTVLQNCLTDWRFHDHPVVCVSKNEKIIAAIEVRENAVFQAYTAYNNDLDKIEGLPEAFDIWCSINGLSPPPSGNPPLFGNIF